VGARRERARRLHALPQELQDPEGQPGFCFIRANVAGKLRSLAYGRPVAVHVDPIEKKPLFHFLPAA